MSEQRTALTIGFFDGVHRGHQALVARTVAAARERGLSPQGVTFDLHRMEVLHGRGPLQTLSTTEEKVALLRAHGLAEIHVLEFTPEFAAQSGRAFVERVLVGELHAAHVVVGHDFRFGHQRSSGVDDLAAYGEPHGLSVDVVQPITLDGERVSSRHIRERLSAGDVAAAARALGRPFALAGEVVSGQRLGRTLGFPTANLAVDPRKLLPALGVYAARVPLDGTVHPAVLNLGRRPTVDGTELRLEVHLLDFDGDLYGRHLTVQFAARLRPEQRFDGLDALRAQITADVAAARAALAAL